jgi:hypothetical protein
MHPCLAKRAELKTSRSLKLYASILTEIYCNLGTVQLFSRGLLIILKQLHHIPPFLEVGTTKEEAIISEKEVTQPKSIG